MIEWCDELDFDKYLDGWQKLATSGVSDLEMPNVRIAGHFRLFIMKKSIARQSRRMSTTKNS